MKWSHDYFDNLPEFLGETLKTPSHKRKSSVKNSYRFTGTHDIDESIKYAEYGVDLDKIEVEMKEVEGNTREQLQASFDVSGSEVEMGMYMQGLPECMVEYNMHEVANKFVHIVIGVTEAGGINSQSIINRAAAVASIIDNLENNNYRVRLSMAIGNSGFKRDSGMEGNMTIVDIKDYDEIMPISNLSGLLHVGFFRRLIFLYWEGHQKWGKPYGYGKCPSRGTNVAEIKKMDCLDSEHWLYLPSITERQGGSYGIQGDAFRTTHDAKNYADYVSNNIEKLMEIDSKK